MSLESDSFSFFEEQFKRGFVEEVAGNLAATKPDPRTTVPLETNRNGIDDPFYLAQIQQRALEGIIEPSVESSALLGSLYSEPYRSIAQRETLGLLNHRFADPIRDRRLAVSTLMLITFTAGSDKPRPYRERIVIAGRFNKFGINEFDGDETLVALFTDPNFIDPDSIDTSDIPQVAIPVLGVDDWHPTY